MASTNNGNNILPNISRSKGNQNMKFGLLKEYKMKNIFLEKFFLNVMKKLLADPFLKNHK